MIDMFKKGILTGIGMAVVAKDTMEAIAKELTDMGSMSEDEGRKFVDDLKRSSEKARKDMEDRVREMVRDALDRMDLATKQDVDKLKARIRKLERENAELTEALNDEQPELRGDDFDEESGVR